MAVLILYPILTDEQVRDQMIVSGFNPADIASEELTAAIADARKLLAEARELAANVRIAARIKTVIDKIGIPQNEDEARALLDRRKEARNRKESGDIYNVSEDAQGRGAAESAPKKASADYIAKTRDEFERSGGVREQYWKNEYATNKSAYSPQNQALIKQGKAPFGTDGKPIILHHKIPIEYGGTNVFSNLQPMRYSDHSLSPNFGPLHTPPFLDD